MSDSPPSRLKRRGDLTILSHHHKQARDGQRRSLWEPSSKINNNFTLKANPVGIDSNAQTSLHSTGSCACRASPSVKLPKSSRCLAPPCKPGASGTTLSIVVLTSPTSFRAVPDWRSYTDSGLLSIGSVSKAGASSPL